MSTSLRELWQRSFPEVTADAAPEQSYRPPGSTLSESRTAPLPKDKAAAVSSGYQLLEEIGAGGMGVVYRGRQACLDREVAIKTPRAQRSQAFHNEARALGRLDHPNIIPAHVLEEGERGPMLVMKLAEGRPWSAVLAARSAPAAELEVEVERLLQIGNALAFAHARCIAHLDLKPENVMIGDFGEVLLMDWGLAVPLDPDDPHRPDLESPRGTPRYMAPEQARGEGDALGAATDVFLMGATLHEILTGRPPHEGEGFWEVLAAAAEARPPRYSAEVPAELAAIAAKAMARQPEDRYPEVAALSEDLRAFLSHRESRRGAALALAALNGVAGEGDRSRVYRGLTESLSGFEQALSLWPENPEAREGRRRARLRYARAALDFGDLALAEEQCGRLPDDEEKNELRAAIARAVRDEAKRRRTQRIARLWLYAEAVLVPFALVIGLLYLHRKNEALSVAVAGATRAAAAERAAKNEARGALDQAQKNLRASLMARAETYLERRQFGEARAAIGEALTIADGLDGRAALFAASQAPFSDPVMIPPPAGDRWSRMVSGLGRLVLISEGGGLWHMEDDGPRLLVESGVEEARVSRNGRFVAWLAGGRLVLHDFEENKRRELGRVGAGSFDFEPWSLFLAHWETGGRLRVWAAPEDRLLFNAYEPARPAPLGFRFSLGSLKQSNDCLVWALGSGSELVLRCNKGPSVTLGAPDLSTSVPDRIVALEADTDGVFYCGTRKGSVARFKYGEKGDREAAPNFEFEAHRSEVVLLNASQFFDQVASASASGEVILWRSTDKGLELRSRLNATGARSTALCSSSAGLAVGDEAGLIRVWQTADASVIARFQLDEPIEALASRLEKGGELYALTRSGLRRWRRSRRAPAALVRGRADLLDIAEDGRVAGVFKNLVMIEKGLRRFRSSEPWRLAFAIALKDISGKREPEDPRVEGAPKNALIARFTPDGARLLMVGASGRLKIVGGEGEKPRKLALETPLRARLGFLSPERAVVQRVDGALLFVDLAAAKLVGQRALDPASAWCAYPAGRCLYLAERGAILRVNFEGALAEERLFEGLEAKPSALMVAGEGLWVEDERGRLRIDLVTGERRRDEGAGSRVVHGGFGAGPSESARRLLFGRGDRVIAVKIDGLRRVEGARFVEKGRRLIVRGAERSAIVEVEALRSVLESSVAELLGED